MSYTTSYTAPIVVAPAVEVIPSDFTPEEVGGVPVILSDIWHGRRGPTKSKASAIALAERMANAYDAFVVRREESEEYGTIWAVRMLLEATTGSPLITRRPTA